MPNISLDDIEDAARAALERHGARPWIAGEVAGALHFLRVQDQDHAINARRTVKTT